MGVCKFSRGFLVGLVNVLLSYSFAAWLKASSSLLLMITGCTYRSRRALACFRVPDVGTMLVDNVEAFSFVQNFRNVLDCCSVSGSTVVKLEACQRSTVCTPLHRHDRHRCISHLEVDLSVRTAGSQRCTTHTAQWQLSSSATISILMQNTCTSKQLNPRNNNWTITRCLHTPNCSTYRCFVI